MVLHRQSTFLVVIALVAVSGCGSGATGVHPVGTSGCGGTGSVGSLIAGTAPSPGLGEVSGFVTDTRGGPGLSGVTVTAVGTTSSAVTDGQGAYSLTPLNSNTYDLVASRPDLAASKFQSVKVVNGQTATINMIMRAPFDATKDFTTAPTISVSGLTQGDTVSGTVVIIVTVTASNPVRRIDLRTSNMNALSQASQVDSSTAFFSLDTGQLANGANFVDIIAYDLNYDTAELVIGFVASNSLGGSPWGTPTGLTVTAVTTGQSIGLLTAQRSRTFSTLQIQRDPTLLNLPKRRSINLMAAPSNSTMFVELTWDFQPGGIKVYRSLSPIGPFALIAQIFGAVYDDADPSLSPGVTVYYRLSAYTQNAETALSAAVGVTPLSAFNVSLSAPANNATGVLVTPTFVWSFSPSVAKQYCYDIFVRGLTDSADSWVTSDFALVDRTSTAYGTGGSVLASTLQRGKAYQWDIYQAIGITVYASDSLAIAVANGGVLTEPTGSLNGPFTFTTAAQ